MKPINFTKAELDLICECALSAISDLDERGRKMPLESLRIAIQENIVKCNAIIVKIAKHYEEEGVE